MTDTIYIVSEADEINLTMVGSMQHMGNSSVK